MSHAEYESSQTTPFHRDSTFAKVEGDSLFQTLIELSSDIIFRMSPDWKEMYFLCGRGIVDDTLATDRNWLCKYVPTADHVYVLGVVKDAIQESKVLELEHRIVCIDGSFGWTYSRAVPIRNASDEITEWIGICKDITERKSSQEALRESNERYRLLIESMREGFAMVEVIRDANGQVTDIVFIELNHGFETQTGLPSRLLLGRRLTEVFKGTNVSQWLNAFAGVADTSQATEFAMYVAALNHWYEVNAFSRGPNRIAVFYRNVTQNKQAEAALRESEQRLKLFIEHAPVALAMFDRDMRYLSVSQRFVHDYLPGRGRIIGMHHYEVFPECPERWREAHRRALRGETVRVAEDSWGKADGQLLWARFEVRPWFAADGNIGGIILFTEDITERRNAELKLQNSEECFHSIFNFAPIGIAIANWNGEIRKCNPAYCQLLGCNESELIGKNCIQFVHADDLGAELAQRDRLRAGTLSFFETENRYLRKDGIPVWVHKIVSVLRDQQGNPTCLIVLAMDISQRRIHDSRMAADLEAMTFLNEIGALYVRENNFKSVLKSIVNAAIAITSANFGDIELLDAAQGKLEVVTKVGLPDGWVEFLNQAALDRRVCRKLNKYQRHVVVEDIEATAASFSSHELKAHRDAGIRAIITTPLVSRDGRIIGAFSTYYPVPHKPDDRTLAFLDLLARQAADIVDRQLSEAMIHDRDEHLRSILEAASDAIISIDEQGSIVSVNSATERLFGFRRNELIGRNVNVLMPEPYHSNHDAYLERFRKTRVPHVIGIGREAIGQRKDGSQFPIDLAVSEIDHLGQFTGIIRDISERKNLQRDILAIADEEQRRIGQDLHDSVQQELAAVGLLTKTLEKIVERNFHRLPADLGASQLDLARKLASGINRAHLEIRQISKGLVSIPLDKDGLFNALHELAARTESGQNLCCTFEGDSAAHLEPGNSITHLYRIAQEAVTNAIKHAQAMHIEIRLYADGHQVVLQIRDDGRGIAEPTRNEGMGVKTMRYRAGLMGASLSIEAIKTGGTMVTCRFPRQLERFPHEK